MHSVKSTNFLEGHITPAVLRDDNLILALPTGFVSDTKCHLKKSDKATPNNTLSFLNLDGRVYFKPKAK